MLAGMLSIKPIDKDAIFSARKAKLIVTVEEHSVIGGLGSAVGDVLAETGGMPPLLKLGVHDEFLSVGDYNYLIEQTHLSPEAIVNDVLRKIDL